MTDRTPMPDLFEDLFNQLLESVNQRRSFKANSADPIDLIENRDRLNELRAGLATARQRLDAWKFETETKVGTAESREASVEESPTVKQAA